MRLIIEDRKAGIVVTEWINFEGKAQYTVNYGFEVSHHFTYYEALKEYIECAKHSISDCTA